jgi:hypothetical protein
MKLNNREEQEVQQQQQQKEDEHTVGNKNAKLLGNNAYLLKLKKAFQLIMNDLPDNRDDTINSKLLDSLKHETNKKNYTDDSRSSCSSSKQEELVEFLRSFLLNEILISEQFKLEITNKDAEVVQFFIDLTAILIQSLVNKQKLNYFLSKTLDFLHSYFQSHFDTQFLNESIICCSIINLISNLYELINSENSETNEFKLFNDIILDSYLFTNSSLLNHLQIHCKSIFVRKSFKHLLNKHLVYLIETSNRTRLERILNCFSSSEMPFEFKVHNLDVYSLLIQNFFFKDFNNQINSAKLKMLLFVHEKLNFNAEKPDYLNSFTQFTNDASIEAFTFIFVFDLIISFRRDKDTSLLESLSHTLNKSCAHFVSQSFQTTCHANNKNTAFKKSIDHLFKFLIYFYSFLNQMNSSVLNEHLNLESNYISDQFNLVKSTIRHMLIMPLDLNLNSNIQSDILTNLFYCTHSSLLKSSDLITGNYLNSEMPLGLKHLLLKQCIFNLRLFIRKFPGENLRLFEFISHKQIIYLLRHLDINLETKNLLLGFLIDYYAPSFFASNETLCNCLTERNNEQLANLVDSYLELFQLKLCESFNENIFKLITIHLDKVDEASKLILANKLSRIVLSHLKSVTNLEAKNDYSCVLSEQLNILMSFMCNLLTNSFIYIQFVSVIVSQSDFFILKNCSSILASNLVTEAGTAINDSLTDFKDNVFKFYKCLFVALSQFNSSESKCLAQTFTFETSIFTYEFMNSIEQTCQQETEAFIRREAVHFLINYRAYQLKLLISHLSITDTQSEKPEKCDVNNRTVINFFSHLIMHDFDWQIQLYCLEYFESIVQNVSINFYLLDKTSSLEPGLGNYTLIEIMFCLSDFLKALFSSLNDCDQHVVSKASSIILCLKQNKEFVNAFENFCKKETNKSCYLDRFLNDADLDSELAVHLEASKASSDIYIINPEAILDDIISSYQFELDDEKFIDCY